MEVKIGILLPRSDMFPKLAVDFLNGIKLPFKNSVGQECVPNYLIESVGNATDLSLLQRVEKMLLQEEVDVIVTFCSFFMLDGLITIANSYQKPIIHVTLGARVLKPQHSSPYVVHASLNLCQTSYLSGQYAVANFGKRAALLSSFYDGGYQLTESFFRGFTDHGGEIIYNYVSPMDYKSETFDGMVNDLKETNPDVIFSIFSYKEGNKVLAKLAQSELDYIPNVAVPLMTDESNEIEASLPKNCYSIASWSFDDESEAMNAFFINYQKTYTEVPNIISLLGDEVGSILTYCIQNEQSIPKKIGDFLAQKELTSSRGILQFSAYHESIPKSFMLRKLEGLNGNYQNELVAVLDSASSETIYKKMEDLPYTGWKNPYICT